MTKEEAIAELERIIKEDDGDPESQHGNADYVLVELLRSLGYEDVTAVWEEVPRWYA